MTEKTKLKRLIREAKKEQRKSNSNIYQKWIEETEKRIGEMK